MACAWRCALELVGQPEGQARARPGPGPVSAFGQNPCIEFAGTSRLAGS